jgi:hypothetical protein
MEPKKQKQQQPNRADLKIILIGDSAVGKSKYAFYPSFNEYKAGGAIPARRLVSGSN